MKHKLAFTLALWWLILCGIGGVFLLVMADKRPRESESENRMLAGFPKLSGESLLSGSFTSDFESFLTDGFFARDGVIALSEKMLDGFNALSEDEKLAVAAESMEERMEDETQLAAQDAQDAPLDVVDDADGDASDDPEAWADFDDDTDEEDSEPIEIPEGDFPLTAKHSYLWYKQTNGKNLINYQYENEKIATYAETLQILQGYLPDDGVICFTQVPLAQMANRWTDQKKTFSGWGSSVELVLEKYLENTERIYVFSTYELLEPHLAAGEKMFYHTDHHWTAEGAYLVLCEMLKKQNLPVIPYDEYTYRSLKGRQNTAGYVDTFNVLTPLLPGHSYVVKNRTELTEISLMNYRNNSYRAFMNNTRQPWRRIITGAHTGRKALVICDSFGNAFTPYLMLYYDEVDMCDFRYAHYSPEDAGGTIGELIGYFGIDDVYIVTSTANGLRKDNSIYYLRKFLVG